MATAKWPTAILTQADIGGEMPNFPTLTLNGTHTAGVTTIVVNEAIPSGWAQEGWIVIDDEIIKHTSWTTSTFSGLTRGAQGTTAAAHDDDAQVLKGLTKDQWNQIAAEVIAIQTELGTNLGNVVEALDRDVSQAEVVNTTTETTVYTKSIPGGTLGTDKLLILECVADAFNNTGLNVSLELRVKYGGTVIGIFTSTLSPSAGRRAVAIRSLLAAAGTTNAQRTSVYLAISIDGSAGAPPSGGAIPSGGDAVSVNNGLAIDSTTAQDLIVTARWDTASTAASFRLFTAHLMQV